MDEGKIYTYLARYTFRAYTYILLFYIGWLVLGIRRVDTTAIIEASDEQKGLEQALFLVELLKSEYARVLRENDEMQRNNVLRKEDSMTCPTTKKVEPEGAHATPLYNHLSRRNQPIFPLVRKWRQRPSQIGSNLYYDIPVRRYYNDEDYGHKENAGGWRRFQYEDAFGPQPGGINVHSTTIAVAPTIVDALSSATAQTTTTTGNENNDVFTESNPSSVVTIPRMTTIFYTKATSSALPASTIVDKPKTLTTHPTILKHATQKMKLSFSKTISSDASDVLTTYEDGHNISYVTNTSLLLTAIKNVTSSIKTSGQKMILISSRKPRTIDLELSQAAVELENELGANFENRFHVLNGQPGKLSASWRASTRVHLAGSTRYSIPLPENHAFCYSNPTSALCRTFI